MAHGIFTRPCQKKMNLKIFYFFRPICFRARVSKWPTEADSRFHDQVWQKNTITPKLKAFYFLKQIISRARIPKWSTGIDSRSIRAGVRRFDSCFSHQCIDQLFFFPRVRSGLSSCPRFCRITEKNFAQRRDYYLVQRCCSIQAKFRCSKGFSTSPCCSCWFCSWCWFSNCA